MTAQLPLALITGGNAGIGKETAIGLVRAGYSVIITSRDPQRGEEAMREIRERGESEAIECLPLDLASFASIRSLAETLRRRGAPLHVLIENAGLILSERRETEDGLEMTFGVNHLGHFLLTRELLPLLEKADRSRIVIVASNAHRSVRSLDFDDLQSRRRYSAWTAYNRSKLANIYFARELARRLSERDIPVYALHPGVVATSFTKDEDTKGLVAWSWKLIQPFLRTPEQGAQTSIYLATSKDPDLQNGGYYADCRPARLSSAATDDTAARRLWEASEAMIESITR